MEAINQLVETFYSATDPETVDFIIFQKPQLDIYDHYRFWLRVLQDHMIFIIKRSKQYEQQARDFLNGLTELKQILMSEVPSDFSQFNEQVREIVEGIRDFKRSILSDLVNQPQPHITLPPTFISHMLNELDKFRFIIHYVKANGEFPPANNLNEHTLWLLDIIGHLDGIKDNLDPVEKLLRKRLHEQKKIFKGLHHKALEFIGYFLNGVKSTRNVERLDVPSMEATILYLNLVKEILLLRSHNVALGVVDRHMLLHMIFEEIYYLKSLDGSAQSYDPLAATQIKFSAKSVAALEAMP